jgi:hypothetical protein
MFGIVGFIPTAIMYVRMYVWMDGCRYICLCSVSVLSVSGKGLRWNDPHTKDPKNVYKQEIQHNEMITLSSYGKSAQVDEEHTKGQEEDLSVRPFPLLILVVRLQN